MTALILTPDQARAVVGCSACGGMKSWVRSSIPGMAEHICPKCRAEPPARFIPSDTPDRYQPGEWVEVRALGVGSDVLLPDESVARVCYVAPDGRMACERPWDANWTRFDPAELQPLNVVGRVRLGEAREIGGEDHETYDDPSLAFVGGRLLLTEWTGHPVCEHSDTDITAPHLTLWPDAFTPGTYAHEIIERSPS